MPLPPSPSAVSKYYQAYYTGGELVRKPAKFTDADLEPDMAAKDVSALYGNWNAAVKVTPGKILGAFLNEANAFNPGNSKLKDACLAALPLDPSLAVFLAEAEMRLLPKTSAKFYPAALARLATAYSRAKLGNVIVGVGDWKASSQDLAH